MSKLFTTLIALGLLIAAWPVVESTIGSVASWLYSLSNVAFGLLFAGSTLLAWFVCGMIFGERR